MAACRSCRRLLDELTEISTLAGALAPLSPPDRVWNAIAERVAAEDRTRRLGHRLAAWAIPGGALAAAAALVFAIRAPAVARARPRVPGQA